MDSFIKLVDELNFPDKFRSEIAVQCQKNKPYDEVLGAAQLIKLEIHLIV